MSFSSPLVDAVVEEAPARSMICGRFLAVGGMMGNAVVYDRSDNPWMPLELSLLIPSAKADAVEDANNKASA